MKRFLRYFLYRELYRWIRNSGKDDESGSSPSPDVPDSGPQSTQQRVDEVPIDEGPLESLDDLKTVLQQMDPYDFEHFVADLWTRMGWETDVSSAAMDEGVDVTARKHHPYEQTTLIQAKRYGPNTTVGSPDIQQYASLSQQYSGVDKVVIVTTNEFTDPARDLASRLNVKLIDGDSLAELIVEHDALGLVDDYLEFVTTVDSESAGNGPQHTEQDTAETEDQEAGEPTQVATPGTGSSSRAEAVPSTLWEKLTMVAIPGWLVAFFGVEVLPEALWAVVFFAVWFGLPIALYLDITHVREYREWPEYWWAYVLPSLIWLLAIIPAGVYLWRRRALTEAAETETDASQATGTAPAGTRSTETGTTDQPNADATPAVASPSTEAESTAEDGAADPIPERRGDRMAIDYRGQQYTAQTAISRNGTYTAAYQDGRPGTTNGDSELGRVFLYHGDTLQFTTELQRPNEAAVANDGTVAFVDWHDWGDTLSGTLHVFNESGHRLVKQNFDANIGPVAITPDGDYVATSTFNPDCSTYLFDVAAGEQLLSHENQHGNVQHLEFTSRDGGWMLRLGGPDDGAAYGIDFGGHVIWKSKHLKRQDRLDTLLETGSEADLTEAIDILNEAMELASEDYEQRNVAQQLAETHWKRAKAIKRDDGVTDDWWAQLDQAAQYYRQTLPRYAGKHGLAKVKRKQGDQYLKNGDDSAARDCFQEIADLEDEYDVQLLTAADKRRLGGS